MSSTIAPYPGGKHTLAPLLVRFMPKLPRHISGFGGMANEILAMPQRKIRIYNDKNRIYVFFFLVLQKKKLG